MQPARLATCYTGCVDKTMVTVASFDATADAYQSRFMDCASYDSGLSAFSALLPTRARVLDLGCGPGNTARFLLDRRPDLRFTGIDLSSAMVERFRKNNPGTEALVMDLRRIEVLPSGFDAVLASFCLPFFTGAEADAFIRSLSGLIAPGGHLYLSTMQGTGQGFEKTSFGGDREFFFNYYTRDSLDALLAAAGFQVLSYEEQIFEQQDKPNLIDMIYLARRCHLPEQAANAS